MIQSVVSPEKQEAKFVLGELYPMDATNFQMCYYII